MSLLPQRPTTWCETAVWQDVEFGSYAADLPLWERLSEDAGGPVVELGAGSGRVAIHLARRGVTVAAIESDPELVEELAGRAEADDLPITAAQGDITKADLPAASLVIAPLQVMQMLDDAARDRSLASLAEGMEPGSQLAVALVDETTLVERGEGPDPKPDMREVEGWVYSSEPLWVQVLDDRLRMRRMRERVSPEGDIVRRVHDDVLFRLPPERLENDAQAAGLRPVKRHQVESNDYEAGSVVVVLEAT